VREKKKYFDEETHLIDEKIRWRNPVSIGGIAADAQESCPLIIPSRRKRTNFLGGRGGYRGGGGTPFRGRARTGFKEGR